MVNTLPSETKTNYAPLILTGSWQRHLDWRRLGRPPHRDCYFGARIPRLGVEPFIPGKERKKFCRHVGGESKKTSS